jgi:hypothetical protein
MPHGIRRQYQIVNARGLAVERIIPYQNLYVYEISGEISDSKTFFQEDFIGCWNEGEMSCLFFSAPHDREVQAFIGEKRFRLLSTHVMDYKAWQAGEELAHLGGNERGIDRPHGIGEGCPRGLNPSFISKVFCRCCIRLSGHTPFANT